MHASYAQAAESAPKMFIIDGGHHCREAGPSDKSMRKEVSSLLERELL
jgi:hypothetical protein